MFVLVAHFRLPGSSGASIPPSALEALDMLAASTECRRLHFAHSTESPERFVLVAEFDTAATYRRALSPWSMRTVVVPWLATAQLEVSEVSEVLFSAVDGAVARSDPTVPDPGR